VQEGEPRRALRHRVERPKGEPPRVEFEVFEPKRRRRCRRHGDARQGDLRLLRRGAAARARARAACAQRGGADVVFDAKGRRTGGARMLAVVTLRPGEKGGTTGCPRSATTRRAQGAGAGRALLEEWERGGKQGLCPVPDEPRPPGMVRVLAVRSACSATACSSGATSSRRGRRWRFLAVSVSRFADIFNALCQWENTKNQVRHLFTRQALPILWDFAEGSALGEQAGDHSTTLATMVRVVDALVDSRLSSGQVQLADAAEHPLPNETAPVWFTDPPYYDAVPYADLSDFFLVWLKRMLPGHSSLRDPFDPTNPLSPKGREAVQDETKQDGGRPKDASWFEEAMARAFAEGRRVLREDGVGSVVFAHKTTEGWEALLSA
jgi:putative DNA methylase